MVAEWDLMFSDDDDEVVESSSLTASIMNLSIARSRGGQLGHLSRAPKFGSGILAKTPKSDSSSLEDDDDMDDFEDLPPWLRSALATPPTYSPISSSSQSPSLPAREHFASLSPCPSLDYSPSPAATLISNLPGCQSGIEDDIPTTVDLSPISLPAEWPEIDVEGTGVSVDHVITVLRRN